MNLHLFQRHQFQLKIPLHFQLLETHQQNSLVKMKNKLIFHMQSGFWTPLLIFLDDAVIVEAKSSPGLEQPIEATKSEVEISANWIKKACKLKKKTKNLTHFRYNIIHIHYNVYWIWLSFSYQWLCVLTSVVFFLYNNKSDIQITWHMNFVYNTEIHWVAYLMKK